MSGRRRARARADFVHVARNIVLIFVEMAKLTQAQEYEQLFHYCQEGIYKQAEYELTDNIKRAIRRKAKLFTIKGGILYYTEGKLSS